MPWELAHAAIWQFAFAGPDDQLVPTLLVLASWAFVGINVGVALIDRRHRAVHDHFAGSIVVLARDIH